MARYKVQGPNGEIIEIEGPEGANPADVIAQAQTLYQPKPEQSTWDKFTEPFKDVSVKDWAEKSFLAPALQTMQSVTPFGLLRPDMAAMNLKQGSQNLVGKGQQLAQGAYNVATNPVESAQKAYTAVTENPAGVAGSLAKGILYDPEMLIGSGLGNLAEKGIKSTVSGVGKAAAVPIDFGRGAFRGMAYPGGTAPNTALVPIKPNYVPHEQVRQFMAGERPATSLTTAPTSELINQTTGGRWAYGMAPKNAAGERLVPAQGRLMEGIGENIGGGIRTNPLQGLVDIGGIIGGVGPVGSMIKAVPAAATTRLSQATNFEPGFVAARNAALAREGRAGLQGSLPQTPLLSGPVRPGGEYTPTVYVGPTGEATTNVAGTQTNYRPAPARSSTFNEVRGGGFGQASQTPAELARAAAAERITPPKTPEQQAILDRIRARAQASGAKYTPPQVDTPTVAPVTPTELPPAAVVAPAAATSTLDQLRSRLTPRTPEEQAAVDTYNALSPAEKAAQTRAENAAKKGPPGTIGMIADDGAEMWRTLKTKTQTLEDGTVVKTYPYDEAGKVKVQETKGPGQYGRTERVYNNTETGATLNEKFGAPDDLLDRKIKLPDGTEINQRFASEMRNGQPVRTDGTEIVKNKQKDQYYDGKYSHSYNGRNSLVKGPVNGKLPDIESLIKQIKGE